ncbi:transcriptional regulator GcvA [Achromobacter sp. GG226]|uniref:transcriptional regulator GcvA n=1 Tax=Verticiella alkaliphila TaxID=2779529 RepID=UPI001C0ADA1C|nr:transcriptional regulator GcvA [Verticiella sp. GG226]MBU4611060.1 transcriptional regulator GcvA [Verticiella sp. GG226]
MFHRRFLPPTAQLMAFESAARHASVSRAAEELHLTQSAVSRQIQQLEASLGVALFQRHRQRLVLTDAGRLYAAEVRPGLQTLAEASQKVMRHGGSRGLLNLAVLPTFGTRWLIPRMPRFAARHPDVLVHFATRLEPFDFEREPFDAAVHFGDPVWPGTQCDLLLPESVVPVCSPAFLARHPVRERADLTGLPLLQQTTRPALWLEWFEQSGLGAAWAMQGAHFEQFAMMAAAAAAGMGVGLMPHCLVEEELGNGRLVALFRPMRLQTQAYYLAVPEARAAEPLVSAFRTWLREEAQAAVTAAQDVVPHITDAPDGASVDPVRAWR